MNGWKFWDRILNVFSWLVLALEVVHVALRFCLPDGAWMAQVNRVAGWCLPVLLAGAVGYITNWLALWYLFKPYEPRLGGRIQGIIPRQKKQMAVSMGRMVGQKLLNPDALVEEMKREVSVYVAEPRNLESIRDSALNFLLAHTDEIVTFVTPYVERQVVDVFDSLATEETWSSLWNEEILPRLKSETSRRFVVNKFVDVLKENAGGIIGEVRGELRTYLQMRLGENLLFAMFASQITDYVMNNVADEASLRSKLEGWLTRETTQEMLREKMLACADQLTTWMKGAEGQAVMGGLIRELKVRGKRFLGTYIREKVPALITRAFASELLREKLEHVLLPKVGERVVQFITDNKQTILDKLRLEARVAEAVDNMSVASFHTTLQEFMAENFCAVQVLGFVLGAFVGALQLLARLG